MNIGKKREKIEVNIYIKQDRQCTYYVTLWRVRLAVVAMEEP